MDYLIPASTMLSCALPKTGTYFPLIAVILCYNKSKKNLMKRVKIFLAALIISSVGFQSCSKDKQEEIATTVATNYVNNGKWKITKFEEDGKNETDHFAGYVFEFNTNGTVTASKDEKVVRGTWSKGDNKFIINFDTAPFNELNEDWVVKNGNATSMQLQHVSGGDGSIDYLNFEKI
jgi:hypothetical protein